jgi:hypothetical protein
MSVLNLLSPYSDCIKVTTCGTCDAAKQKTASYGPQQVVVGIQKVGRGRTVSRVLCPLRDGDHLSGTPVARRL